MPHIHQERVDASMWVCGAKVLWKDMNGCMGVWLVAWTHGHGCWALETDGSMSKSRYVLFLNNINNSIDTRTKFNRGD